MDTHTEAVEKLYVAYFSRPADAGGLAYWTQAVATAKGDVTAVSAAFAASQEYRDTYAGKPPGTIIDTIYRNLFGRAAEQAALEFWGWALANKAISIDDAVLQISAAAQGGDILVLRNKLAAAGAFSAALDTPLEALGYAGASANEAAKAWLAGIGSDASLAGAIEPAALAAEVAEVAQSGPVNTQPGYLTAGIDTITGTAGADSFVAGVDVSVDSTWNTLGPGDAIDGGAGSDTLVLAAYTRLDGALLAAMKNIETLELQGAGVVVLDSSSMAGLTLVNGAAATGVLTISAGSGVTARGGVADDVLTARGANAVLHGGAGNDTLKVAGVAASAVILTGGAGDDLFDLSAFVAANAGAAATITDLAEGERIAFAASAGANFVSAKVSLIAEATFGNYAAEAARNADGAAASHGIAWFQYNGNTFIVQDVNGNGSFDGGADIIVKLTGLVDLGSASFNAGAGTLMLV